MIRKLRQWAHPHTREGRYSPIGITFHWTMAGLITFQLWWGWRTSRLPVGGEKLEAYELHAALGLVILILALLRMAYRMVIPGPVNDADHPGWQRTAAHLTHYAFYLLFFALPVSGWAMLSATGREIELSLFGLPWPHLPFETLSRETRWRLEEWAEQIHWLAVWGMLLLIPAHVGAALKHYFWDKDDVLPAMAPVLEELGDSDEEPSTGRDA